MIFKELTLSDLQIWFKEILEKKEFKELTGKKVHELRKTMKKGCSGE